MSVNLQGSRNVTLARINGARSVLRRMSGREPTINDIADYVNLNRKYVGNVLRRERKALSELEENKTL